MIKTPFKDPKSRMTKYLIFSFILGLIATGITRGQNNGAGFINYMFQYAFFVVTGIFSSIFAYCRLKAPGISDQCRRLILKRHVAFIAFFMICNLYLFVLCLDNFRNRDYNMLVDTRHSRFKIVIKFLFFS